MGRKGTKKTTCTEEERRGGGIGGDLDEGGEMWVGIESGRGGDGKV